MEKADILEMTVKHLKQKGSPQGSDVIDRYRAGYMACLQTTLDYLGNHSNLSKDVQMNLAQAISCRMLQYKKCEMISVKSPTSVPSGSSAHVHSSPSFATESALVAATNSERPNTCAQYGRRRGKRFSSGSISPTDFANSAANICDTDVQPYGNCPRSVSESRDFRSVSESRDFRLSSETRNFTFLNSSRMNEASDTNRRFSVNEDSGFLEDKVFADSPSPSYSSAVDSPNFTNTTASNRFNFDFSRLRNCSSEVWRPW